MSRWTASRSLQLDRALDVGQDEVSAALVLDEQLVDDFGKVAEIGGHELRAVGEATVALHHIVAETDLAHLAVRDDVDADLALPSHDLGDGLLDARLQLRLVDRLLSRRSHIMRVRSGGRGRLPHAWSGCGRGSAALPPPLCIQRRGLSEAVTPSSY